MKNPTPDQAMRVMDKAHKVSELVNLSPSVAGMVYSTLMEQEIAKCKCDQCTSKRVLRELAR